MARGDHPRRTPVYGAALIVAAMVAGTAVTFWVHPPSWLRVAVLVVGLLAVIVGGVMTLRDYTGTKWQ